MAAVRARERRRKDRSPQQKKQSKPPFRRRLLARLPIVVGSILLALIYGNSVVFRRLEAFTQDFIMRVRTPRENNDIVVVLITRNDYKKCFGAKSPLDPNVVTTIIAAIASAKPKVIGVDIDTSSETFDSIKLSDNWPPVVWARNAAYFPSEKKHVLSKLLGRDSPSAAYGLTALRPDSDGVIRRYPRWYDTDAQPTAATASFSWAILQKSRNAENAAPSAPDFNEEFLIDYGGPALPKHFQTIPVSQLPGISDQAPFAEGNVLENRIVILGGDYAVEDEQYTPIGWVPASEILAAIIETEQQGGGRKPMGTFAFLLLAIMDSLVLLSLIHRFGLWKTLLISILLLPVMAMLLSLILFGSLFYTGNLLFILILILSYEVYEKGKDYFKKWREEAVETVK